MNDNNESLDKYVEGLLKFTNYAYGYYSISDYDTAKQCLGLADRYYNKLSMLDPDYTKHFSKQYLELKKDMETKYKR